MAPFLYLLTLVALTVAAPTTDSSKRQLGFGRGSSTRNDLVDGLCRPVTIIFARGTTEAGNVGSVVGPPMVEAIEAVFGAGNVAVQGVDYAANVAGFVGDPAGNKEMADLVNQAAEDCPDTQIVVSGYSQGAMLVHNSVDQYTDAGLAAVKAAVLFGDPFSRLPVDRIAEGDVKTFCATGDAVCLGTAIITAAHLSYGGDAEEAAEFVQSKITV